MAVKDNFYSYYTYLLTNLQETYPAIKGGTVYKGTPPSFPYLYFKHIDAPTALTTLSGTEAGINLSVQAEIYSATSAADARAVSNVARGIMIELGFECRYFQPVENVGDTSIHRFIGRYEKLET